ncbi:T9SS type B sorting domain-containing protein [Sphingobacterium faecale]|uniref:Gliding motility-associated C-terminal domain-containing protein n=1 Tax=Sphingobacterium faecale TaxID=2803775 RepID=A0ABS1R7J4_9SPHI|nr:gliding motility-associated C-terminal domain-containing protein [Sphingobacterium faecale]MBL1410490.1 gliding motility-associated C-terminal domain-containing protein [Sphingobacterium faecale]
MHRLSLTLSILVLLLLAAPRSLMAQQGQTLRIIKGKKVTLRADATHAVSFIWFKNGEPINGSHDQRIIVTDAATYTVIALGDGCSSDVSDPVEIIFDPDAEEKLVDIEIRNLPDKTTIWKDESFNQQLLVLNNSNNTANDLIVEFEIPNQLAYVDAISESGTTISFDNQSGRLVWKIDELKAHAALSQWIQLKGVQTGEAVTIAKVTSKKQDSNLDNNQSQASIKIVNFFIPNVFTPNGDGDNDTFFILGLELFKNAELRVFNRLGNEVYRADNYRNDWNGQGLNDGTYFYYLKFEDETGQTHVNKGYVTILRNHYY